MTLCIKLGVISADPLVRKSSAEFAAAFGFELAASLTPDPWRAAAEVLESVQCWLVDEKFFDEDYPEAEACLESSEASIIYGVREFNAEPEPKRHEFYALLKKVMPLLAEDLSPSEVPDIWVLGASAGGPEAVKIFLDALPEDLPICFLYAQHLNEVGSSALAGVIGRDAKFQVSVIDGVTVLRPGFVYIVPVDSSIDFVDGVCFKTGVPWAGSYQPSIEELLKKVSYSFGSKSSIVFFSGMGEDGALVAADMARRGSSVWSQSTQSAVSAAMPESIIRQGICEFIAAPSDLAALLKRRYSHHGQEAANQ